MRKTGARKSRSGWAKQPEIREKRSTVSPADEITNADGIRFGPKRNVSKGAWPNRIIHKLCAIGRLAYNDYYLLSAIARPLSGCVGRALFGYSVAKALTCAGETSAGVLRTIQVTLSLQGGIVSDPSNM